MKQFNIIFHWPTNDSFLDFHISKFTDSFKPQSDAKQEHRGEVNGLHIELNHRWGIFALQEIYFS